MVIDLTRKQVPHLTSLYVIVLKLSPRHGVVPFNTAEIVESTTVILRTTGNFNK